MKQNLHIILVDDNDIDVVVNTKLIKLGNLTENISSFQSGAAVIKHLEENRETLSGLDNILLLDIQMPLMDGFETLQRFEALPEDYKSCFKVFMLSSSIDRNDIQKAEQNGTIIKVLEKPLDVYLLRRLIGI